MKFAAVGDILAQRRLPPTYEGFDEIVNWMSGCDVKCFNLETTINRPSDDCYGFFYNGGSFLRANPEILEDCRRFGFNMTSFCNNHAFDWSYEGLLKTLDYLDEGGWVHAGCGRNLDEAAAPAYLDATGGRVALIGITSSVNDACMAGRQSRRVRGRPGVNKLRYKETLVVTPEQMQNLKELAAATDVNGPDEIVRKEGYLPPMAEGYFDFGRNLHFREGQVCGRETTCEPADLKRVERAIYEAKFQSDFILITIHSHEPKGAVKDEPSQFLEEFAHKCIDMGADAVIGHGPHLLRPIEVYKGKPIFYSLGDFVLENENAPYAPEDFFNKQGLTCDDALHDFYRKRSNEFTRGLQTQKVMFETVLPRWEMDETGKLTKLELLAVELGFGKPPRSQSGLPAPANDGTILERLAKMSAPYGVTMQITGNTATVILD